MTTAFKVAWFEFLYQVKSKFFILGMLVMLVFLWNEFSPYIMHLPIDNDEDIRQLRAAGVHDDMLFVEVSPEQTLSAVIEHMESYPLSAENDLAARELAAEEKNRGLSLQEAERLIRERYPSFVPQWEIFVEEQGRRLGTVEEIVPVFRSYYGEHSFSNEFAALWVDRLQIMLSFLSIPAFLMLFFKDRRFHTTEWLRAKPVAGLKYVTGKYCGTVLAWMLPAILLTSAVNVWLGTQFTAQGYAYRFADLFLGMAVLALPAFMLAGAVIIVLGFLLRNEMAALPVFLVYLLFNITSGAFAADPEHPLRSIKFLIRLDGAAFADWLAFIPRQGIQLAVTIAIVLTAGRMWGKQGFDGKGRL